jgi:hypothetical protein
MIELAKTTESFDAPIEKLFTYVTNMENYGSWFPGVKKISSKNGLPHATVGKTYLEKLVLPDGEQDLTISVVKCEENKLFLTQGDLAGLLPQMKISYESKGENRCIMTLEYHSRNVDLVEKSELVTSLREDLAKRSISALNKLKSIIEE